jgi:copper chaperone CopZ
MNIEPTTDGVERSVTLSISGMTCSGCVRSVKTVLLDVEGVMAVEIDLNTGSAVIEGTARPEALTDAVGGAGYEARLDYPPNEGL